MENNERYQAALNRNLSELSRAILIRKVIIGIENYNTKYISTFIHIIYEALFNDMISHSIKVFENRKGNASFWYLFKYKEKEVNEYIKTIELNINEFEEITKKLKHVRDKTHFHIDRDAVKDPEVVWNSVNIKGNELAAAIDKAHLILKYLYLIEYKKEFFMPIFDSAEATEIVKFAEKTHYKYL